MVPQLSCAARMLPMRSRPDHRNPSRLTISEIFAAPALRTLDRSSVITLGVTAANSNAAALPSSID